jgi:hypothetical protein
MPSPIMVDPPSREELLDYDIELCDAYRAATLLADGRSRRGRKTKHDTATRRWCERVGFPAITRGKRPPAADMAMLRLSPRISLSGADLKARDAWSQLHGRDPRSKQQTAAERLSQQTLLDWARINAATVGTPSSVRRGRVAAYAIDFGAVWRGFTPRQLALSAAYGATRSRQLATQSVPAGAWLTWVTGQAPLVRTAPFRWRFPDHLYLYLAMRELEVEGRVVVGNDGPIALALSAAAHKAYEAYVDLRLAPTDITATTVGDDERVDADADAADVPPAEGNAEEEAPVAGALRVPPPPEPVERVETAMSKAQVDFFKGILGEMANGDRPPYKEWQQLTVRHGSLHTSFHSLPGPPHPSPLLSLLMRTRARHRQVSPADAICAPCGDADGSLDLNEAYSLMPIRFWSNERWGISTPCVNEGYAHAEHVTL